MQGVEAAVERLREFGEDLDLPMRAILDLCFLAEEMLVCVQSGAFAAGERATLRIQAALEKKNLRVSVEWDGKPFDPLAAPMLSLDTPLEDVSLDGLEMHLLRRFSDELDYTRQGNVNRLRCLRRIADPEPAA